MTSSDPVDSLPALQAAACWEDYRAYARLAGRYLAYARRPYGDAAMLRRLARMYAAYATDAKRRARKLRRQDGVQCKKPGDGRPGSSTMINAWSR